MSKERISEEAKQAAKWWAKWLEAQGKFDNGDNSLDGILAKNLASQNKPQFQKGYIKEFKLQLQQEIEKSFKATRARDISLILSCDYGPTGCFREILQQLQFPESICIFPWKSAMWIKKGEIKVRVGYGGEMEVLYKKKGTKE